MLAKIFTIFIGLSIVFSNSINTFIVTNYWVNKAKIIELFCVNKEETKFKCDGQCHLKDQIKKTKKKESKQLPEISNENSFNFIEVSFKNLSIPKVQSVVNKYKFSEVNYRNIYIFILDPPPKFV